MNLSRVVAVVSGGGSGLGLATVSQIVRHGGRAVIADLPGSPGDQAANELNAEVGEKRCVFHPTDVTNEAQVQAAMDISASLGHLNTVVNCAGVAHAVKTFGKKGPHPLGPFMQTLTVNIAGTFNMVRLGTAKMCEKEDESGGGDKLGGGDRGVIVNTASVAAYDGQIGQVAYAASKGAIVSMTLPLARDLAGLRIRVNTIAPGLFDTALLAGLPEKVKQDLAKEVPYPQRLGDPAEFAQLVQAILENPMLNGETIRLDGAIRMKP